MNAKFTKIVAVFLLAEIISSCSTREEIVTPNDVITSTESSITQRQAMKKETALLVGRVLRDSKVRDYVVNQMKEVSDGEVVSFSYLAGKEKGLRKNEVVKFKQKKSTGKALSQNVFVNALKEEIEKNQKDFRTINDLYEAKKQASVSARVPADDLTGVLSEGQQLYMPYNETYSASYVPQRYYTSDEMLDGSPTNSGYYFDGYTEKYIPSMDNNFIDSKPTFIVSETDPCDIEGGTCTTVELSPTTFTAPPPLVGASYLLKYNVDHYLLNDHDIIYSKIPKIKVTAKDWLGFGAMLRPTLQQLFLKN